MNNEGYIIHTTSFFLNWDLINFLVRKIYLRFTSIFTCLDVFEKLVSKHSQNETQKINTKTILRNLSVFMLTHLS